jgi:hypothetical protein
VPTRRIFQCKRPRNPDAAKAVGLVIARVLLATAAGNPAPRRPSLPHRRADPGGSTAPARATSTKVRPTVECAAAALIDLDIHVQSATDATFDIGGFEQAALARIGMLADIVMRHRPTHFQHIFAGDSYAAAYYSYLWSEVLDSDAFEAFEETGDIFHPGVAKKLHDHVYAPGGSRSGPALRRVPRATADP